MSHPAIRARQNGTPYVVCPDRELVEKYYGQKMTITVRGDAVDIKKGSGSAGLTAVKRKLKIQVPSANLNSNSAGIAGLLKNICCNSKDLKTREKEVFPEPFQP